MPRFNDPKECAFLIIIIFSFSYYVFYPIKEKLNLFIKRWMIYLQSDVSTFQS